MNLDDRADGPLPEVLLQLQHKYHKDQGALDSWAHDAGFLLECLGRDDFSALLQTQCMDAAASWISCALKMIPTNPGVPSTIHSTLSNDQWLVLLSSPLRKWSRLPSMQKSLKLLTEKSINLFITLKNEFPDYQETLRELVCIILSHNKGYRGVYFTVELLAKRGGCSYIFDFEPNFINRISYMKDPNLSSFVGRGVSSVLCALYREMAKDHPLSCDEVWFQRWRDPVVMLLQSSDERSQSAMKTYFLGPLLRQSSKSSILFMQYLNSTGDKNNLILGMTIGRAEGILPTNPEDVEILLDLSKGFFSDCLRKSKLILRLNILRFLLCNPKPTSRISQSTFNLFLDSMPSIFKESDPDFCHQLVRIFNLFLDRFRVSTFHASKHCELEPNQQVLYEGRDFLKSLVHELETDLEVGKSHPKVAMALRFIECLVTSGMTEVPSAGAQHDKVGVRINIFLPNMVRRILDRLSDQFEDVQVLSLNIIRRIPLESHVYVLDLLSTRCRDLEHVTRARDCEGRARLFQLSFQLQWEAESRRPLPDFQKPLNVFDGILDNLMTKIEIAKIDILNGANSYPLHSSFLALKHCMEFVFKNWTSTQSCKDWKIALNNIIFTCFECWHLVSPIICHDSPEGNFALGSKETEVTEISSLRNQAQVILSYGWRALKEASSLLGSILSSVLSSSDSSIGKLLTMNDIRRCGQLFQDWMLFIRHRGAFSAVQPAFELFINQLFHEPSHMILIDEWIKVSRRVLSFLIFIKFTLDAALLRSRSVTRRSGGLPMYLVSLLAGEIDPQFPFLHKSMKSLFETCSMSNANSAQFDEFPQVHAMNILKDLFTDSRIASRVLPFVEEGFRISVLGFSSEEYPIRNCSIMLFNALVNRSCGPKSASEEPEAMLSSRNFSTEDFFNKYPSLFYNLGSQLKHESAQITDNSMLLHELGIYPILILLSRLNLPKYNMRIKFDMSSFRDSVLACLKCNIWQVRAVAARALPKTYKSVDDLPEEIYKLLETIPLQTNGVHGYLLGAYEMIKLWKANLFSYIPSEGK